MSDIAKLARLVDAVENAQAAMLLAHDELFFGGNWTVAKARLKEAGTRLDKALDTANRALERTSPRLSFEACLTLRDDPPARPKQEDVE